MLYDGMSSRAGYHGRIDELTFLTVQKHRPRAFGSILGEFYRVRGPRLSRAGRFARTNISRNFRQDGNPQGSSTHLKTSRRIQWFQGRHFQTLMPKLNRSPSSSQREVSIHKSCETRKQPRLVIQCLTVRGGGRVQLLDVMGTWATSTTIDESASGAPTVEATSSEIHLRFERVFAQSALIRFFSVSRSEVMTIDAKPQAPMKSRKVGKAGTGRSGASHAAGVRR